MAKDKLYDSVLEMIGDVTSDRKLKKELAEQIHNKQIAKALFSFRCKQKLTQEDIAQKTGWSQGKVSKVEHSKDIEFSLNDLEKYCDALNLNINITFSDKNTTLADRVKIHYSMFRYYLNRILEIAKGDKLMEDKASDFFVEASVNIFFGFMECLKKLKKTKLIREEQPTIHVSESLDFDTISEKYLEKSPTTA